MVHEHGAIQQERALRICFLEASIVNIAFARASVATIVATSVDIVAVIIIISNAVDICACDDSSVRQHAPSRSTHTRTILIKVVWHKRGAAVGRQGSATNGRFTQAAPHAFHLLRQAIVQPPTLLRFLQTRRVNTDDKCERHADGSPASRA